MIALHNAGIVVDNPATLVGMGDLKQPSVILATLGFFLIVGLESLKVRGAVLIGILAVTVAVDRDGRHAVRRRSCRCHLRWHLPSCSWTSPVPSM